MPQYYNFSKYSEVTDATSYIKITSDLMNHILGVGLVVLTFIVPVIYMIRNGETVNNAINVSSLYALLMAIFLYVAQILVHTIVIWVCALIYIITLIVRYYNK